MTPARFLSVLVLATLHTVPATAQTRLLRSPTVSQSQIAFAYANNIWVVDRSGGSARRMTSFPGQSSNPKFSPDGKWLAFSAENGGNTDVYVVSSQGGELRRLTWHPSNDIVEGWSPDGAQIVFASTRATDAPSPAPRFFMIPAQGGMAKPMPMARAFQGKISPDGKRIAYRMASSWDDQRRNYRGGQNRPIWILDLATYDLETPQWTDSRDIDPVWIGNTVFFISDRDGVSNVWSYDRSAKSLRQVTTFKDFEVKSLDAGGGALVFEQGGWIHEMDPASGTVKQVKITVAGDFPWMMPQWKDVSTRVTSLAISPSGKRVAVEARGEIFTIPADKGDVRNLTSASGSGEKAPAWSPDGRFVSYFSDKSGEYKLYIESQDGVSAPREITIPEPTQYYTPAWSPNGKRILFHDTHLRIWTVDVATGAAKIIGNDAWLVPERTLNPAWSPDSRYIAYAKRLPSMYRAIFVHNVETGDTKQVTDGLADAVWPAWDASGKYLWFLASTTYALASQWLDMSSYERPVTRGLYLAVLSKSEPSPLLPESDEEAARAGAPVPEPGQPPREERRARRDTATGRDSASTSRDTTVKLRAHPANAMMRIDFDGLQRRIIPVADLALRDYGQLRAGAPGTVFMIENMAQAGTAQAPGATGGALHRFQLSDRKAIPFVSGVAQYVVSANGLKVLYRTPGAQSALFLVDADKMAPSATQGRLNATLRMLVDPKAEFTQIFNEGWRNQRDYFYVKNMHGTDWPKMKQDYGAMLPHVAHRADLNYLLDEMGSETAIGHSYVRGGDMPEVPQSVAGLLGADFAIENGRYRITRIYDAESWNPELRAPLAGPGISAKVGDYILAVDGVELKAPDDIYRLLDGTVNRQTVLTINSRPVVEGARRETVIPVASEQGLRARAWVEKNRRIVDSLSNGLLAYVHVPNTGQGGYTSFNRYYFAQQDRQGAIIDERYNGGGSAADYIIDILQRDFDGYFNSAVGDRYPFTSPSAGIWGPKVMIINEMAGSGGDLMPYMFHRRKIGPLVGKRTWGGLVHTADTPLFIDGGSMIAPRGGFFTRDGKWAVENEGVAPDIDVENFPKDVIAGRDPQLERAVQVALQALKDKPVNRMKTEPPPPTWGKRGTQR